MRQGPLVLLEIKGRGGELWDKDRVLAKNTAAKKWVAAVNNVGCWGQWEFEMRRDLAELRGTLERHAKSSAETKVLPFRIVRPKKGEQFKTCVPLTTLRAAAGRFSEEQAGFDDRAEWAEEWVTWDVAPPFESEMFVARVQGGSMEPEVPNGSYCLSGRRAADQERAESYLFGIPVSRTRTRVGSTRSRSIRVRRRRRERMGGGTRKIVLKPLNPAHQPIVLAPESEEQVRVIAEFLSIVGGVTNA